MYSKEIICRMVSDPMVTKWMVIQYSSYGLNNKLKKILSRDSNNKLGQYLNAWKQFDCPLGCYSDVTRSNKIMIMCDVRDLT